MSLPEPRWSADHWEGMRVSLQLQRGRRDRAEADGRGVGHGQREGVQVEGTGDRGAACSAEVAPPSSWSLKVWKVGREDPPNSLSLGGRSLVSSRVGGAKVPHPAGTKLRQGDGVQPWRCSGNGN